MRIFGGAKKNPPPPAPKPTASPLPVHPTPVVAVAPTPPVVRPAEPFLAPSYSRPQRPKLRYPLLEGIRVELNTTGLPKVTKLDLIDRPVKTSTYHPPDLSVEVELISAAEAAIAAENERLRKRREEEDQTERALRESIELQVILSEVRLVILHLTFVP